MNTLFFAGYDYCPIQKSNIRKTRECSDATQSVIDSIAMNDAKLLAYVNEYAFNNQAMKNLDALRQELLYYIERRIESDRLNELQKDAVASVTVTSFSSGRGVTPYGEQSDKETAKKMSDIAAKLGRGYDSEKVASGFHTHYYWHKN